MEIFSFICCDCRSFFNSTNFISSLRNSSFNSFTFVSACILSAGESSCKGKTAKILIRESRVNSSNSGQIEETGECVQIEEGKVKRTTTYDPFRERDQRLHTKRNTRCQLHNRIRRFLIILFLNRILHFRRYEIPSVDNDTSNKNSLGPRSTPRITIRRVSKFRECIPSNNCTRCLHGRRSFTRE